MTNMDQTEQIMRTIATGIDTAMKEFEPKMGFCLLVFPFGNPGIGNYIGNADRSDMIKVLRETADRLEANEDIPAVEGSA
jgi:hypothetical protein